MDTKSQFVLIAKRILRELRILYAVVATGIKRSPKHIDARRARMKAKSSIKMSSHHHGSNQSFPSTSGLYERNRAAMNGSMPYKTRYARRLGVHFGQSLSTLE